MKIESFKLERYFAQYEFNTPFLLSCSDCEPLAMKDLLSMAHEESSRLWEELKLAYTDSMGNPILREEISKLYPNISSEEMLVCTPEEGIYIAMNSLLNEGDHVITTFPGYQSLYEIAISNKCKVSKWTPNEEMCFKLEDLFKQISDKTKLIVINFPHNPTGETITPGDLKQIVSLAREKNIVVFSDEMYRFLEYDSADRLPSVSEIYENGISLFGLSKTFALPGLRIGWLTTKNINMLAEIAAYKDYTTICSSAPSEILGIIALQNKNQIIERNLHIIQHNLEIAEDFLARNENLFKWRKPLAGTISFPELKVNGTIHDFCLDLIEKKGVMLLPSDVYDFDRKCVRIGFGRKNFPEAISLFEDYLNEKNN
ncbi:MAG: aminotransferase class I/II-fold pyridoxal phosphate-dependent enzyme [Bacteroidales bacterium]|nr:aminotransferase class I/II-fold pyridoxal phosphate-dependent enzyme [Bacteroidales bacterium]